MWQTGCGANGRIARRRRALLGGLGAGLLSAALPVRSAAADRWAGDGSWLEPKRLLLREELLREKRAFGERGDGSLESVFGVPVAEVGAILFPVSRARALPDAFAPSDLVFDHGHPLRAGVAGELGEMFAAAGRERAYPMVVSGYRSFNEQVAIFTGAVERQLDRPEPIERAEAERRAARFVARPGRSQHQLGTTADLSSWELGYTLRASFAETVAGRWLVDRAWEFGFILPYTAAAEARTGYAPEPWHLRWVGRPLAAFLWERAYLQSGYPTADDWLVAIEGFVAERLAATESA